MNNIILNEKIKIEDMIYEIRGKQIMLDSDLAKLYECKNGTKEINQAVKNNLEKFQKRERNPNHSSSQTVSKLEVLFGPGLGHIDTLLCSGHQRVLGHVSCDWPVCACISAVYRGMLQYLVILLMCCSSSSKELESPLVASFLDSRSLLRAELF